MSKKTLAILSVTMIVVFGFTVIVYPLIFNSEKKAIPVNEPVQQMPLAPAQ